jgi:hypothetical protein
VALLAAVVVVAVAVAVVVATAAAVALLLNNPLLIFIMQGRRKPSLFFIFTRQIFPASLRSGNVQRRLNCNLSPGRTSHQTLRVSLFIINAAMNRQPNKIEFMKVTKRLILAALLAGGVLVCDTTLRAQNAYTNLPAPAGPLGGGMRARVMPTVEQLTTNLSLTADQIPKVKAALDDQKQKLADLRADTSIQPPDRRAKMQDIRTELTAKMKAILTEDQFVKYQKLVPGQRTRPAAPAIQITNAPAATP